MEPIAKIVRERLKAAAPAGAHPDPDLLTGLVEKSVSPREQAEVLGHLASCADCREVVSLAMPEFELQRVAAVAAVAAPLPAAARWYSSRALRWGAAVACLAVVSLAVLRYRKENNELASVKTYSATAERDEATVPKPPVPKEQQPVQHERQSRNEEGLRLVAPPAAVPSSSSRGKDKTIIKIPESGAAFGNLAAPHTAVAPVPAAPPPLPHAVAKEPANQPQTELSKIANTAEKKEQVADKLQSPPAATNETVTVAATAAPVSTETVQVQRSKDSANTKQDLDLKAGAAVAGLTDSQRVAGNFRSALTLPPPLWRISPQGRLLESRTQGENWTTVPVAENTTLRALCVNGKEIWVGGAQGALYYSSDSGARWEQVKPAANGRTLTSDIAAIEFANSKHGKLTTANQEIWTTADGGHSWQTN